jgi:putative ABC transport system permease protein
MTRLGTGTLFRRQLLADWGAAATVVIVVLTVAGLLAAWPRAIDHMFTNEVRERVALSAAVPRDVSGEALVSVPRLGEDVSVSQIYAQFDRDLAGVRSQARPLVREMLGNAQYQLVGRQAPTDQVPEYLRQVQLTLLADPDFSDRIRIVEGELPAAVDVANDGARTFDLALSAATAERVDWPVGQVRQLGDPPTYTGPPRFAKLTATFEAADPSDDYWAHSLGVLDPFEEKADPAEPFSVTVFARGFIAPAAVASGTAFQVEAQIWFPVDGTALEADSAPQALDELRAFLGRTYQVSLGESEVRALPGQLRLGSATTDTLDETLTRQASATALLALVAAGPFGVALAVLALGSRLVVERRRRTIALASARGASRRQLRSMLMAEGALLGLPAAALAVAGTAWLVPGRAGLSGIVLPVLVGMAPVVLLPFIANPGRSGTERADLGRRRGRLRWSMEIFVLGAATASVIVLNQRGLTAGEPGGGVDALLIAAPLLVAVAVGVIVLRLYPVPVAALGRMLRRGPGIVGFVGTVRAVRDQAAGLAPVLALVIGLSVAVFSTVLWSTTQSGGASASTLAVGADIAVIGPTMTEEHRQAVAKLDGVTAAALVTRRGLEVVTVGDRTARAQIFVTDTGTLAQVQATLTGVPPIAADMDQPGGEIPVMVPDGFAEPGDRGNLDMFEGFDIVVAGVAEQIAGLPASGPWVLVDRASLATVQRGPDEPGQILMADTEPGVVVDAARIQDALGGTAAPVRTASDVVADVRAGAVGTGLVVSFLIAVVVVGTLSVTAVLLTMVIAAPSRRRLLSQLRTLGITGRQAQGLTTLEMAPLAAVSVVFGLGLGLGIPWLVFSALDLRPLTGAETQPPVAVDWLLVAGAVGLFVGIVALAVGVAVVSSRRLQLGVVLRVGEEL